jgi:hypothetical protein
MSALDSIASRLDTYAATRELRRDHPYAADIAARELAALRSENARLRARAGPEPLRIGDLRPGQVVSDAELVGLHREQRAGRFPADQLREAIVIDRTGRRSSYFFGDAASCWGAFSYPAKIVRSFHIP